MTDVDVDLSWLAPSMPNGVIEGYRIYFMTGNFTDVRSVPAMASSAKGQDYQHHQRSFPSGTVTGRINYDQSPSGVLALDQQQLQMGSYGHSHGARKASGAHGFDEEERALIYKLTNLSK